MPQLRRSAAVAVAVGTVLIAALTACGRSEGAQEPRPRRGELPAWATSRPSYPTEGVTKITVEFEASPDMMATVTEGTFVVSAFQVGFFDGSTLVRAAEVPRSAARITGRKITLDVPLFPQTRGVPSSVSLRVRGLSAGSLGPWSQAVGPVDLLPAESGGGAMAARRGPASGPQREKPSVTMADIEALPRLKEVLTEELKGRLPLDEAVSRFANVRDLALAVTLSRRLKFSFPRLCEAMETARALPQALRGLTHDVDLRQEMNSARPEALGLIAAANGRP